MQRGRRVAVIPHCSLATRPATSARCSLAHGTLPPHPHRAAAISKLTVVAYRTQVVAGLNFKARVHFDTTSPAGHEAVITAHKPLYGDELQVKSVERNAAL